MRTRPLAAVVCLALAPLAGAQDSQDTPPVVISPRERDEGPELAPAVQRLLEAPYLTDDERRDLRLKHGVWTDADLDTPARRAHAALVIGAIASPALDDPGADAEDRAEALMLRGDPEGAIKALEGLSTIRAVRVRAESLAMLGRFDEADAAIDPLVDRMVRLRLDDPDQVGEGVRALMLRAKIRGSEGAGGGDFRLMARILARVRDEQDRLTWTARLVEAELLRDKHNNEEARAAAIETLRYNPRCAEAYRILGEIAVDGFAFDASNQFASKLDQLASPEGVLEWRGSFSSMAGLVRARARLRQRDPEGAEMALDPTLAALPDQREALALEAACAAVAFRYNSMDRALEHYETLSPGTPEALAAVGAALAEARQYDVAPDYLEKAIERLPNWSTPIIELGLLEVQSGRDNRARRWLARAVELDPFNVRAVNSLKLVNDLAAFEMIESDHFFVRYKPGVDAVMAREMLPILEQIHERVAGDGPHSIHYEPDQKTLIELMPDHAWFSVRITGMPQIHTMAAATGPVIAMEAPREGAGHKIGPYDWPRVIQHEYTHTVTLARTHNRIPHWFTEAAAVYLENVPRDEQTWRLLASAHASGHLFDLEQINIAFVRPKLPTDRQQAYAQGHWMYQFIAETWGEDAPLKLMDRYAVGEPEQSAFETVLGVSSVELLDRFESWAAEDLMAHGMRLPDGVPGVPEMLDEDRAAAEDPASVQPDLAFTDRWLEKYPEHPDLLGLRAELLVREGGGVLSPEAVAALEAYAKARPVAEGPHKQLARHFLLSDSDAERARAIPHLEFLDEREEQSGAYAIELARLYVWTGEWDKAWAKADRATQISPYNAAYREFAARVAIKANRLDDAERDIQALCELEPDREIHKQRLDALHDLMR
ncbi:MAG: hypothetical protein R3B57_03150 [Phycisphaerales bacterium]